VSLVAALSMLSSLGVPVTFVTPHVNYVAILPELILIAERSCCSSQASSFCEGAGSVLLGRLRYDRGRRARRLTGDLRDVQARGPFTTIADSVAVDGFAIAFLVLVSCILILASAIANDFLVREAIEGPEYHVLALLAGSGAMLMASANDLILIFVALEIMSIPLYILAGMDSKRRESGEAAMNTSSSARSPRPSSSTGSLSCTGQQGRPTSRR